MMKDWVEMISDKIRAYYQHEMEGLKTISLRGDWVDYDSGFLARVSIGEWNATSEEVHKWNETLDQKIKDLTKFAEGNPMIGVSKKIYLVDWYQTEKEAKRIASYVGKTKVWNCKTKKWV